MPEYSYEGSDLLQLGEQLRNYNAAIAEMIVARAASGDRVLDFGAGFGTLTRLIAERTTKPDCVEPDARQRRVLEDNGFACYESVASVPAEMYDLVYSSNVLEHIEDDVQALRELYRTLRPGGKVVLYLPAFQSLYTALDTAIGHYRRYDIPMINERLRAAGFSLVESYYVDVIGYVVASIFKRISNNVASVNPKTMKIYDGFVFPVSCFIERFGRPPFGKNVMAVGLRPAKK